MLWRIGLFLVTLSIFKITKGGVLQTTPREDEGEEEDTLTIFVNETSELHSMMKAINDTLVDLGRALENLGRLFENPTRKNPRRKNPRRKNPTRKNPRRKNPRRKNPRRKNPRRKKGY